VDFNRAGERIEKISRDKVIGKSVLQVFPGVKEFGLFGVFQRVWRTGQPERYPVTLYKDNRISGWRENYVYRLPGGEIVAIYDDITELKQAEEELKESEEKFVRAFQTSPNLMAITTPREGLITEINEAYCRVLGYEREECIGHTTTELNVWADPEQRDGIVRQVLKEGRVINILADARTKSGEIRSLIFSMAPITLSGKEYLLSVATDITERRKQEQALADEVTRRRILVEQSRDGIVVLDTDAKVYEANQAFAEMLGYSPEEVRELHTWDWDTQWSREQLLEMGNSVDEAGLHLETRHRRKDGTLIDVEISVSAAIYAGQKLIFCVCRDVTERRRAEETIRESEALLHEICSITKIGGWEMDLITRKAKWTKGLYDIVEINYEDPIPGPDEHVIYYLPEYRPIVEDAMQKLIEEDVPMDYEAKYQTAKGNIRWCHVLGKSVRKKGECIKVYGTAQDITERKRMEEALKESRDYLVTLTNSMADAVFAVKMPERTIEWVNDSFKLIGCKTGECVGRTTEFLYPDRKGFTDFGNKMKKAIEEGKEIMCTEAELKRKDGSCFPAEITATFLREKGEVVRVTSIVRDITERKKAEEALRESEEKFSKAFRSSPDRIAITTLEDGRFIDVNDSYVRFTGYTREEVIGHTIIELGSWVDTGNRARIVQKLKEQGQVYNEEVQLILKSGEIRTSLFSAELINIEGEPCMISVATDITDRKRAEEQLRQSEERYKNLFQLAPDSIFTIDTKGRITSANPATLNLTGFSEDELVGKHFSKLPTARLRDIPKYVKMLVPLLKGKIPESFEAAFNTKDGEQRWGEVHINLMKSMGKIQGVQAITRDITDRKRAEEALKEREQRYRELADSITDVFFAMDKELRYTYWNKASETLTGVTSEKALGKQIYDVFPDSADTRKAEATYREVLRTKAPRFFKAQYTLESRKYIFEISAYPSADGIAVFSKDITEHEQLETERQWIEKLESIGTLAGGIAHDFNNYLTGIIGNISLAKRYVKPEGKAIERLEEAEKASIKARDLTQQLLTFSRGGAPVKTVISIQKLIRESAGFALRGSRVKPEFSLPPDLRAVEADEGQIHQVISNIVINADQAMPRGGIINIGAKNLAIKSSRVLPLRAGEYVHITVKDSGVGIPGEHLDRIFEPFFTTKQKGSGLGLTTAYSIVKNHDGYIKVESRPGTGTTVHIYLPVSRKPTLAEEGVVMETTLHGQGRILVMDDEEIIREMLGKMLSLAGYEVELTQDGAEAIDRYSEAKEAKRPFDAVIMDLTVPGGMGGKEAISRLLEIDPDARVIVSSGYATDSIMSEYKKFGFKAVVTKPYSVAQIEKTLYSLLGKNNKS
jgi:PAS domain S-box-containing protein